MNNGQAYPPAQGYPPHQPPPGYPPQGQPPGYPPHQPPPGYPPQGQPPGYPPPYNHYSSNNSKKTLKIVIGIIGGIVFLLVIVVLVFYLVYLSDPLNKALAENDILCQKADKEQVIESEIENNFFSVDDDLKGELEEDLEEGYEGPFYVCKDDKTKDKYNRYTVADFEIRQKAHKKHQWERWPSASEASCEADKAEARQEEWEETFQKPTLEINGEWVLVASLIADIDDLEDDLEDSDLEIGKPDVIDFCD